MYDYEQVANLESEIDKKYIPLRVISMIGYYRNVARCGDYIKVSGILERVENMETGRINYQVVVGSSTNEKEYLEPL